MTNRDRIWSTVSVTAAFFVAVASMRLIDAYFDTFPPPVTVLSFGGTPLVDLPFAVSPWWDVPATVVLAAVAGLVYHACYALSGKDPAQELAYEKLFVFLWSLTVVSVVFGLVLAFLGPALTLLVLAVVAGLVGSNVRDVSEARPRTFRHRLLCAFWYAVLLAPATAAAFGSLPLGLPVAFAFWTPYFLALYALARRVF